MRVRTLAAMAGLALAGGVLVGLSPASPATAASSSTGKCTPVTHLSLDNVQTTGGASAVLTANGLRLRTPEQDSRALWSKAVSVKLADLKGASYTTFKHEGTNAAVLPAFVLGVDADADGVTDTTLVYEPYYQAGANTAVGTLRTWNVDGGKWWASKTIPGLSNPDSSGSTAGSYAGNKTLDEIADANPAAVIVSYGVRMGTWNHDTDATVDKVTLSMPGECAQHRWVEPKTRPTVVFLDACDGSTKVTVATPEENKYAKGWTFAIDRKGDDVPPKLINVDAGQSGVWTMGAGQGPVQVWAYKQGKGHQATGFAVLGNGRGEWKHPREWVNVGDHEWAQPAKCKPVSGAGSSCTRFYVSVGNPAEASKDVEAVLTPGPDADTKTVTLKPGDTVLVEYDAAKVQQVSVSFDGNTAAVHEWQAPEDCDDGIVPPAVPPGTGGGSLPLTGGDVTMFAVGGVATVGVGALAVWAAVARRRRTRFVAS